MSGNFRQIIVCHFEYECAPGDLPDVLCMVAFVLDGNLQHVRIIRLWRGEFGPASPFSTGPDSLFVAYSAQAELTCFKVLGWTFPVHVFDQHTAYLAASNVLLPYEPDKEKRAERKRLLGGKGLEAACNAYGLRGWVGINKDAIRTAIGNGTWHGRYSPEEIVSYCEEDVRMEVELLHLQLRPHASLPAADIPRTLWWSNYSSKAVALIQARGIPIDVPLYNAMRDNRLAVIDALRRQYDPSYHDADPIWTAEGKWSDARFERWLVCAGVPYWPRLERGRLNLEGDTFKMMSHHPGVAGVYTLREALTFIRRDLPIGRDGRNRPSLFPFGTATGRNAHSKSIYNTHAGLRSLIVFPQDKIGVYLDWRTQEVGVAAALSGDPALLHAYRSGDIYHALARICGLTADPDPAHWKKENPDQRQQMKQLQLGINYGMGLRTLSRSLNRHPLIAAEILDQHKRQIRTRAPCSISRCKVTAPKCCGWPPCVCAMRGSSRLCWSMMRSCWRWTTGNRSRRQKRSCAEPGAMSATGWISELMRTRHSSTGRDTRTSGRIRSGFGTPSCGRCRPCGRCRGGRWLEKRK